MQKIKAKRLLPAALLPTRRHGDAGWDLYACTVEMLAPNMLKVGTGIALELPEGYWGQIENRSSMGKAGWDVHGGIVDNIYRGEVMIILVGHTAGAAPVPVEPGAKVAQLIVRRLEDAEWTLEEAETLSTTERGSGGFGSTGR
ncbi:MAG: dUTP diphosphatase [Fibrobacterota bacterium]